MIVKASELVQIGRGKLEAHKQNGGQLGTEEQGTKARTRKEKIEK